MGPGGMMKTEGKRPNRTQFVVLGGLSVVAAAVGFRMMSNGPQSAPAASVAPVAGTLGSPGPADVQAVRVAVAWPRDIARDPFDSRLVIPPVAPPPQPVAPPKVDAPVVAAPVTPTVDVAAVAREKIHLKGTVLGDRPIAMMNGRVYRVGEVIEGFKIVEIGTNQITVERNGSRVVLEAN